MINIDRVSKRYGAFPVLSDCSTSVEQGQVLVICGPSGSGKSTLIKCVNGLEPFQSGRILVDGIEVGDPATDLTALRARVGMVFQNFELFPHLSILQNLTLAQIKVLKRSSAWDCTAPRRNFPRSSPAVSSNASPSRAPWRWIRSPCCSMNRPPPWIRR